VAASQAEEGLRAGLTNPRQHFAGEHIHQPRAADGGFQAHLGFAAFKNAPNYRCIFPVWMLAHRFDDFWFIGNRRG
jgi:hypothetical protein